MKIIHHYNLSTSLAIWVLHGITLPEHTTNLALHAQLTKTWASLRCLQNILSFDCQWTLLSETMPLFFSFVAATIAIAEVPTSAGCTFMGSSRSAMVHSHHWFYVVCKVCKGDFRYKKTFLLFDWLEGESTNAFDFTVAIDNTTKEILHLK